MTKIRPSRFWSGLAPAVTLALSMVAVVRMLQTGQQAGQFVLVAPFLVGSAAILLYVGCMYYVEFDKSAIHQSKYFGFGDKHFEIRR